MRNLIRHISASVLCMLALALISGCKRTSSPQENAKEPVTVAPSAPKRSTFVPDQPEAVAANNRGVGLMGKFEYEQARQVFQSLVDEHPDWLDAKVNLAIATLNRQNEGDEDAAIRILVDVIASDSDHVRAHYCMGLLQLYLKSPAEALSHFQYVATVDPDDAFVAYFAGQCLAQQREYEKAAPQFERAIELDPHVRSAYYAASQAYRALNDADKAAALLEQFLKLERNPRAKLVEFKYTRMGPKGEAQVVNLADPPAPAAKPDGPLFLDTIPLVENSERYNWRLRRNDRPASITACDINGDDLTDVFIPSVLEESGGARNAVCIQQIDGSFVLDVEHWLAHVPEVNAALWGDYDNDGLTDVYLCRRGQNMLWRQTHKNVWSDVTETTATGNGELDTVDGAMFDADHDGDLDIFCVNFDGPNELLNNNLDGTFKPIAAEQGIAGSGRDSIRIKPVDADDDRDVDLAVMQEDGSWKVWLNDRMWQYRAAEVTPEIAAKLNDALVRPDDASDDSATRKDRLWTPVILKGGSAPALIALDDTFTPIMRRPGDGQYAHATVTFTGRKGGNTMRSNASGIGTHFAARFDSQWVLGSTLKRDFGPGQSLQPVAINLAGHPQIDFLSIDWSDGVFQSEIDLQAGEHHIIVETQRQLSSCPVLFAWNGERIEFVSDVLGVGGIGYMVAPHEYAPSRPWENFMLPAGSLQPKDDRYILKLGEPMEEACYLDAARLVAYDLPPGWKMTLDERMNILGPEPTGEARFYQDELSPVRAVNDRGEDVLRTIQTADLLAAPPGEVDHRFIGRLKNDQVLTLEFAEATNALSRKRRVLVIDGWIEYPYSQTMFAAWQAKAEYRAPTIEARSEGGEWRVVMEQFGYPAGMPRQMSVPLDELPTGATQLRITTNQEIYFDRISIAFAEPSPSQFVKHELPLQEARLLETGFAKRTTGSQMQPFYDYSARKPFWDTRYQRGFYTALGEMAELISAHDDAVAIFGPGEEIHMEFTADLPPLEEGFTRVFVLELNGWCKDMDLFTKDGETIEPLPRSLQLDASGDERRQSLHDRFNTRFQSGR